MQFFFAILAILWGGLISLGGLIPLLDPKEADHNPAVYLLLTLVLGIAPLVWGIMQLRGRKKNIKLQQQTAQQLNLIELAQTQKGQITLAEAMVALNLDLPQTKKILDEMLDQNAFELLISETGTLVYRLHADVSGDKQGSQSALD